MIKKTRNLNDGRYFIESMLGESTQNIPKFAACRVKKQVKQIHHHYQYLYKI